MTANQNNYWRLQEDKRHNLVTENIDRDKVTETARHNVRDEELTGQGHQTQIYTSLIKATGRLLGGMPFLLK